MEIVFIPTILLLLKIPSPSQAFCEQKITEDWITTQNSSGYFPLSLDPCCLAWSYLPAKVCLCWFIIFSQSLLAVLTFKPRIL